MIWCTTGWYRSCSCSCLPTRSGMWNSRPSPAAASAASAAAFSSAARASVLRKLGANSSWYGPTWLPGTIGGAVPGGGVVVLGGGDEGSDVEEDVVVMLLSRLAALLAKLRRALLPEPLVTALCISEAGAAWCCCSMHAVRSVLVRMLRPRRAAHGLALAAMTGKCDLVIVGRLYSGSSDFGPRREAQVVSCVRALVSPLCAWYVVVWLTRREARDAGAFRGQVQNCLEHDAQKSGVD